MSEPELYTYVDAGRNLSMLYRPHSADEKVLDHSFDHDIFMPEIPEFKPQQRDVILDIGAHIGTFSCLVARMAPGARIYAIEACEETFEILQQNITRNGMNNVSPIHMMLLDKPGSARLYHDLQKGNWGHSAVAPLSADFEIVACDSMAHFIESKQLDSVDLIRMNCEGAEFPIILTTPISVLRRVKNMLVLHHEYLNEDFKAADITARLRAAGFRVRITNRKSGEGWIIASRARPALGRQLQYLGYKIRFRVKPVAQEFCTILYSIGRRLRDAIG